MLNKDTPVCLQLDSCHSLCQNSEHNFMDEEECVDPWQSSHFWPGMSGKQMLLSARSACRLHDAAPLAFAVVRASLPSQGRVALRPRGDR